MTAPIYLQPDNLFRVPEPESEFYGRAKDKIRIQEITWSTIRTQSHAIEGGLFTGRERCHFQGLKH